jgi:hypothetical protein
MGDGSSLVGKAEDSDTNAFCGQTANIVTAGQVPDACITNASYVSALLSPLDASCPIGEAAADGRAD